MTPDELPYRSHRTDLSTAELLLLDFMFDTVVPRRFFEADAYSAHMNVPYTHGLSADQLDTTLADLNARGLVSAAPGFRRRIEHRLTAAGGEAWERERCPNWDRYVNDYAGWDDDGTPYALVRATTMATARAFLWTARPAGLHVSADGCWTPCKVDGDDAVLIYWKPLPVVAFRATVVVADDDCGRQVDWTRYETERVWWRGIRELQHWHTNRNGDPGSPVENP